MKAFFNRLHYSKNLNIYEKTLTLLLMPASFAYGLTAELRNFCYRKNIIKSYKPNVKTISVGNLTTGGTGKTPITKALANYLTQKGYKAAILSRGYGSKLNSKKINIISDGKEIFYNAQNGGDEPVWLAENCPGVCVLTSSNRVQIAKYAQDTLKCNVLILDDGYQHQKLKRDINILVIDGSKKFGNGKVLPAGPLREKLKNINRADKIIVVNKGQKQNDIQIENYITCNLTADYIYEIHTNKKPENNIKNIIAFSAIGQPEQFYNMLKEANYNLVKTVSFNDHHNYTKDEIEKLLSNLNHAEAVITTEKDAVKIVNLTEKPIYALKLKAEIDMEKLLGNL